MADDFVLNFDAPSSAPQAAARQPRQKGGRWTDRAKEKRFNKLKQQNPRASASTQGSQREDGAQSGGAGGGRKMPGSRMNNRSTQDSSTTNGATNGTTEGGRRLQSTVGPSGKKQFISSLFTADGLPVASNSSSLDSTPAIPVKPSNAPLTHTKPVKEDNAAEEEEEAEEDPAPELTKLGLMKPLVVALSTKLGITGPTACQAGAIPRLIVPSPSKLFPFEHDAILRAQTGSGKTLTFLLPMLQDLLTLPSHLLVPSPSTSSAASTSTSTNPDRSIGTLSLILAPTRELASQIHTVLSSLLSSMPYSSTYSISPRSLTAGLLVGGANRTHEKRRLRKGCPIVVATPGRLLDHLKTTASFRLAGQAVKTKSLAPRGRENANNAPLGTRRGGPNGGGRAGGEEEQLGLRWLIVDECDRLMDLGFEEQMRAILQDLETRSTSGTNRSKRRRTILCSATASEGVDRLAELITGEEGKTPEVIGAREDLKVREPVRRDLTVVSTEKGKKRAAEDDEDEEEEPAKEGEDSTTAIAKIQIPSGFTPPSQLLHHYLIVPPKLRFVSLLALLRKLLVKNRSTGGQGMKILVFMSCTDAVDFWWKAIGGMKLGRDEDVEDEESDSEETKEGGGEKKKKSLASLHPLLPSIPIYRLHGSLPLQTRLASLSAFSTSYKIEDGKREGEETQDAVLLCTSVAARGLDVKNVGCVVQVDAPTEGGITEYIHRVGRTARAGAQGSAYSFLLPSETPYAQLLEDGINSTSDSSSKGAKKTRLREVGVEEVLRDGYGGGKGSREFETRATDVQMGFERWANQSETNAELARKAFQAHIRAYATHPSAEKHIFNTKSLHLGHLAKSFGMREAPGHPSAGSSSSSKKGSSGAKRQKTSNGNGNGKEEKGEGGFETGWKRKQMDSEARMKKLMRGPKGNGGGEFQIAGEEVLGALRKGK
ncbi:putative ATP-dependent RNA helicase [Sporobolomyces salmoneus]|uniref:putative ATP-dependent RNA helicase n=1 Tax=Sporobolomyces salmoneus TaxID=183962 RepID=UPI0031764D39